MSTVITRPNATLSASGGSHTGGTTTHAVLGDNVDTTWIELWPEAGSARVSAPAPTKPAGAVTKQLRVVAKVSSISANTTKFDVWLENGGATIVALNAQQIDGTDVETWATAWVQPGDFTPAQIAAMVLGIRRTATGAWTNLRARELWLETVFAAQPVVSISATASGASTTVTWDSVKGDADTGEYRWYQAWLTDSTGATVFDSGLVDAPTVTQRTASGLAPGTYTWHVRTAHETLSGQGHWAAEKTVDAVIPVTTRAQVLNVAAVSNPTDATVAVTANRDTTQDAWGSVEIERLEGKNLSAPPLGDLQTAVSGVATGWAIASAGTVSATSQSLATGGESGSFQRFAGTVGVSAFRYVYNKQSIPVTPGETVLLALRLKGSVTGTAVARLAFGYDPKTVNSDGWNVDGGFAFNDAAPAAAWGTRVLTAVVPPGVKSLRVSVQISGGASGGTATLDFDLVELYSSKAGWVRIDVPTPSANTVTATDGKVIPGPSIIYRARAVKTDGVIAGNWIYAPTIIHNVVATRLMPVARPDLATTVRFAIPPSRERRRRDYRYDILGGTVVYRHDSLGPAEGTFTFLVDSLAASNALEAAVEYGTILLTCPAAFNFPSGYYQLGTVKEERMVRIIQSVYRAWVIPFTQVERPV